MRFLMGINSSSRWFTLAAAWWLSACAAPGVRVPSTFNPIEDFQIERRVLLGDGAAFGPAGAYETLVGKVHYALDPQAESNSRVTDARLAADSDGLVRYSADIVIVKPVDTSLGNGALLYHVVNRGNFDQKVLNAEQWHEAADAPASSRDRLGRLMRAGFTIVYSGWQADLIEDPQRLRLFAPEAREGGKPVLGRVLAEIEVDDDTNAAYLGSSGHLAFPVDRDSAKDAVLRWHRDYADPGTVIPRDQWDFAAVNEAGERVPSSESAYYPKGFRAHQLYTLAYTTGRSPLMSLCFPAVRDLVDFLSGDDPRSPLVSATGTNPIRWRLGYGSSQSGRFLRDFVYQGFNRSLAGERLFDGIMPDVPGCRTGFFNYRHAQPSRAWGFYPNFDFPFTDLATTDPVTGQTDGILANVPMDEQPKIIYVHHAGEYWSSGAALTHASLDGRTDVPLPSNVRIYTIAGTAHGHVPLVDGRPAADDRFRLPFNPNPPYLVAEPLLDALAQWVILGKEPPPSNFPSFEGRTLVRVEDLRMPQLPGVELPVRAEVHPRFDWGPRYKEGIIDNPLPKLRPLYPVFVSTVGPDGNEEGGIKTPFVAVPLATYTGWNFSRDSASEAGPATAARLSGAWLPFSANQAARLANRDPRPSLEELYPGKEQYLAKLRLAAEDLVRRDLMFLADVDFVLQQGAQMFDAISSGGK